MEYFNLFVLVLGVIAVIWLVAGKKRRVSEIEIRVKNLRARINLLEKAVSLISQFPIDAERTEEDISYFVREAEFLWQKLRSIEEQLDSPKMFRKLIEPETIRLNKIAYQIQLKWGVRVNLK